MENKVVVSAKVQSENKVRFNHRLVNDPDTFEEDYLDDEEVERPRGKNLKKFKHPAEY